MSTNTYSYFIISCKRNINIVKFCVEQLLNSTTIGKIYVSFDEKCDVNFENSRVVVLDGNNEKSSCFGKRIQHALSCISEEYLIVLCDDFIVESKVNESSLKLLQNYMVENRLVSSIALASTSSKKTEECIFNYYRRCANYTYYRITLQCSIWNKTALKKLMEDVKSPWEFELFSNYRTFASCNEFYAIKDDKYQPIKYNRGTFVIRGKIVEPERRRLEEVLDRKIQIEGFETTNSYVQISNMSIFDKIVRRIRMYLNDFRYRIISMYRKDNLNLKTEEK